MSTTSSVQNCPRRKQDTGRVEHESGDGVCVCRTLRSFESLTRLETPIHKAAIVLERRENAQDGLPLIRSPPTSSLPELIKRGPSPPLPTGLQSRIRHPRRSARVSARSEHGPPLLLVLPSRDLTGLPALESAWSPPTKPNLARMPLARPATAAVTQTFESEYGVTEHC